MSQTKLTPQEIGRRGSELYRTRIRQSVEPEHRGKYAAIDVLTGEYEIAPDSIAAAHQLRTRIPESAIFFVRIGLPPIRLGGGFRRVKP